VDEPDRFAKLALNYPDLLDHEEQRIWKLVRECGYLWRGSYSRGPEKEWSWNISESSLIWERLRNHWETFRQIARGTQPMSAVPTWPKTKPQSGEDIDDEIPF
jgi:hypothetical protein